MSNTLDLVNTYNNVKVLGIGADGRRIEQKDYPDVALREMVCNAFCRLGF